MISPTSIQDFPRRLNFPDWVKGEQDEREYLEESDTETDYTRWNYFVVRARMCLRPSDIIDMLLLSTWRSPDT
jgi:hypothetical protein